MEHLKRNLKNIVVFGSLGLLVYLVALYLTLPYEKIIGDRIEALEKRWGIKLAMESIGPVLPIGIKARGIRFSSFEITGGRPLSIDRLEVKIPLLSLLFQPFNRSLTYNFSSGIAKGGIEGILYDSKKASEIALNMKALDMTKLSPLIDTLGFSVKGLIDAKIAVSGGSNIKDLSILNSKGEMELYASDFSLQAVPPDTESAQFDSFSASPLLMALSMQPVSLTKIKTRIVMDNGIIEIKDLDVEKQGLKGKISGSIRLEQEVDSSFIDLNLNLSFTNEENLLRPILMMQGSAIGCPLQPDNTVSCRLNGTIADLAGGSQPSY